MKNRLFCRDSVKTRVKNTDTRHLSRHCVGILAAVLGFALIAGAAAQDHDGHPEVGSPDHWYDQDCCAKNDCMPISDGYVSEKDGKTYYTTKLGTYPVETKNFSSEDGMVYRKATTIRQSKDGRTHACIWNNQLWCLYLPGGT